MDITEIPLLDNVNNATQLVKPVMHPLSTNVTPVLKDTSSKEKLV